jgi:predicted Fe-Mo cluster-binding NifX family protein
MKAAVPIFESDVAPRFGFAERLLVAEIEDHRVVECKEVRIRGQGWPGRLEEIRELGIRILLCGGFNRSFLPLSENLGIRVVTGLSGEGRGVLEQFARGELSLTARAGRPCSRGAGNGKQKPRGRVSEQKGLSGQRQDS